MHTSTQTENSIKWLVDQQALEKRSFYSIRTIKLEGRCFCSGHAAKCQSSNNDLLEEDVSKLWFIEFLMYIKNWLQFQVPPKCNCLHNTDGNNCEKCAPLFNQHVYRPGTAFSENMCEKCECHGHAEECRYSPDIEERGLSMNTRGELLGGGVCVNCTVKPYLLI